MSSDVNFPKGVESTYNENHAKNVSSKETGKLNTGSKTVSVSKNLNERTKEHKEKLEDITKKLKSNEIEIKERKNALEETKNNFSYKLHNRLRKISNKAATLLTNYFPEIKAAADKVKKLESELKPLNEEADELGKQILKIIVEGNKIDSEKKSEAAHNKIKNIFNNLNIKYDAIPNYTRTGKKSGKVETRFIKPKTMRHPIMKGVDGEGRRFIAIKAFNENTKTWACEIFCETKAGSDVWTREERETSFIRKPNGRAYDAVVFGEKYVDQFERQLSHFLKEGGYLQEDNS